MYRGDAHTSKMSFAKRCKIEKDKLKMQLAIMTDNARLEASSDQFKVYILALIREQLSEYDWSDVNVIYGSVPTAKKYKSTDVLKMTRNYFTKQILLPISDDYNYQKKKKMGVSSTVEFVTLNEQAYYLLGFYIFETKPSVQVYLISDDGLRFTSEHRMTSVTDEFLRFLKDNKIISTWDSLMVQILKPTHLK